MTDNLERPDGRTDRTDFGACVHLTKDCFPTIPSVHSLFYFPDFNMFSLTESRLRVIRFLKNVAKDIEAMQEFPDADAVLQACTSRTLKDCTSDIRSVTAL